MIEYISFIIYTIIIPNLKDFTIYINQDNNNQIQNILMANGQSND